ncbi:MAG: phage holin family protein [Candidatus Saccharibacteria bacterium]|nr:phage holin family protein [Candidatus Saccharibacteria bacterium]
MIKNQILSFIFRWMVSTAAMFICIRLFATFAEGAESLQNSLGFYMLAGLVFSLVNSIVRPIATIFSLPLLLLTLGVFTVILNAAMVALTIWILPNVSMSFWGAIGSCLTISLINYLVNITVTDVK